MQYAASCRVEHDPHHLVSAAGYSAAPIDLARLILGARQPKHGPDGLGFSEASGNVDGGAIGQRHHRADTGHRHQAPAYVIVSDDDQQAAVQDDDLFAKRPPDYEQRFDQHGQVGDPLDKLLNARFELYRSHHTNLEAKVAQRGTQIVLDSDRLRLQQLAVSQQH